MSLPLFNGQTLAFVKFQSKYKTFLAQKYILKLSPAKCRPDLNVLPRGIRSCL